MPTVNLGSNYVTLSAMITPALFMTANGSLIISTSNRMSRIVDRIRVVNDVADKLDQGLTAGDYPDLRRGHLAEQVSDLSWRSDRVRMALTMLYMSLSTFIGTSLFLAADALLSSRIVAVPTAMAVAGVTLMLGASVSLTREAHKALKSNRAEVQFYRSLQTRRRADRVDAPATAPGRDAEKTSL